MKKLVLAARVLLGLAFTLSGLNGFLHFFELPEHGGRAGAFLDALRDTGYLWQLKDAVELASGLMILTGFFLPLGLVLLAPVLVNIVLFHLFLDDPVNGLAGYALAALALFLAWAYLPSFRGVLSPRGRSRFAPGGT